MNNHFKPGLLLVNLGSPSKPTPFHVACFLKKFLWDKRVVKLPRLLWWFVLHLIVLPLRSKRVAKLYQKIWGEEGSPLIKYTQNLSYKLEHYLNNDLMNHHLLINNCMNKEFIGKALNNSKSMHNLDLDIADLNINNDSINKTKTFISVFFAMTYSNPSVQSAINEIQSKGITDLIILPLFPQYSGTTTAAVFDKVVLALSRTSIKLPNTYFISHYCHQSAYLMALAATIRIAFEQYGPQERLLFSFMDCLCVKLIKAIPILNCAIRQHRIQRQY